MGHFGRRTIVCPQSIGFTLKDFFKIMLIEKGT